MERSKTYELVKRLYKNEDLQPFELTPSQELIFDCIFKRKYPRNHIMTCTQFGKSEVVSMAILTRASTFSEKWAIVAPTNAKSKIIMGYVIKHIFENDYTSKKFQIGKDENPERIRRERSKNRLTFKTDDNGIGEIFILSAEARRIGEDAGNNLMGFGAPNLVEDESALIPDFIHSKAMRMLGGHPQDNFLVKIGNPFKRNHFLKSFMNQKYHKIFVDYHTALLEGRLKQEYVDEMKNEKLFSILYECKFPSEDMIDDLGYTPLITETQLGLAMVKVPEPAWIGRRKLGVDVARGGDFNTFVLRTANFASLLQKDRSKDLMNVAGNIHKFGAQYKVFIEDEKRRKRLENEEFNGKNIFIDDIGVGGGVVDRLREQRIWVQGINVADRANDAIKFENKKAENYWRMMEWLSLGGKLDPACDWSDLLKIKYKTNSSGKIQIMSKEEMAKNGVSSPDVAEGLMLTFDAPIVKTETEEVISQYQEAFRPVKSTNDVVGDFV